MIANDVARIDFLRHRLPPIRYNRCNTVQTLTGCHMLIRRFLLSLLVLHLAACSTMQSVSVQDVQKQDENSPVQIGDKVEVITRDSEKMNFVVTDITDDGLGGKFGFIPYENIRNLKVNVPGSSDGRSYAWLWGILGVGALIALAVSSDSVSVCSIPPCPGPEE